MASVDWSKINTWMQMLPPNRPSEEILHKINQILIENKNKNKKTVCILGSTPEYRNLFYNTEYQVIVIDISKEFYNASNGMCISNTNEIFIHGNWLEILKNYKNSFNFILSHLTHGNISFEQRTEFFELIHSSLAKDGIFIDYIFQPQFPGYNPKQITNLFKNKPVNLRTINDFNSIALFQSSIIQDIECVDTTIIYDYLEENILNEHVRLILSLTKHITPINNSWDYSFNKTPSKLKYFDLFSPINIFDENKDSSYYKIARLYISRKNNV